MYATTVAALLYTSVYNAIWVGIIPLTDLSAGFLIGNLISAGLGLYMVVAAVILFIDGLRAFNKARLTTAPTAAAAD